MSNYDGPDMEPMTTTSISAKRFVPTHDRYGLPIFRAGDHVKIIIEEGGEAHEFAMPAAEAHAFAQHIHRLADGEDLSKQIGRKLSKALGSQPK